MSKEGDRTTVNYLHLLLKIGGGVLGLYLFLLLLESFTFTGKFGPQVQIAGINIGGKTQVEAINTIQGQWEKYKAGNIIIGDKTYKVSDVATGISAQNSVEEAMKEQQDGYLTFKPLEKANYSLDVTLNDAKVSQILMSEFDKKAIPVEDAKLTITPTVKITPEKVGQKLLLAESRMNIQNAVDNFKLSADLRTEKIQPMVTAAEAQEKLTEAKKAASEDIVATSKYGDFTIPQNELINWLKVSSSEEKSVVFKEDFFPQAQKDRVAYFNEVKVSEWVASIAAKIDKSPVNAAVGIVNGQVSITTASQTGRKTDKADLTRKIMDAATGEKRIEIAVAETQPEMTEAKIGEMGLKELVATGYSDFAGSPANRKVNVRVGASKFNGVLIKPGERFSFNKALGAVDASTGFLPELVIKENKTVPEYGGGLCQVSSTAFRAALNAGLPINERHFHAYPVSYYKPFGVDATIYLPYPDLQFTNDTGNYILIQTRIEGTKLYFDFYGTKAEKTIKFSGNKDATGAVDVVEKMTPTLTDQEARGKGSFTATFFRHIWDKSGKLLANDMFVSKYDTPDNYPH
jgi:vancomycin resistance protein YoaR